MTAPDPAPKATANPRPGLTRGRKILWGIAAALVIALAILIWRLPVLTQEAKLGSAFGARIACSCRYIEGRSLESCKTDFEPGMGMVSLEENAAEKRITASVPVLASRSAHFDANSGCLLDPVD